MGKLASAAFYLSAFIAFVSVFAVIFLKESKYYIGAAILAFIGISGIYLSLKQFSMFALEVLFFVFILGSLIIYLHKNVCLDEKKSLINLNFQTLISPVLLALFAILCIPFAIYYIKSQNIDMLGTSEFISKFIDTFDLNLLILSIMGLAALSGFYTIAFWRKK